MYIYTYNLCMLMIDHVHQHRVWHDPFPVRLPHIMAYLSCTSVPNESFALTAHDGVMGT